MNDFDGLVLFLDYTMRKNLALKIIQSLYHSKSKEILDSVDKVQKLLKLIRPLITDVEDAIEEDMITFDSEQNEVSKLIFVVNSHDPEVIYEIYGELKNVFVDGGANRRKITLPSLAK